MEYPHSETATTIVGSSLNHQTLAARPEAQLLKAIVISTDMELQIQHFAHLDHPLMLVNLRDPATRGLIVTQIKTNAEEKEADNGRWRCWDDDYVRPKGRFDNGEEDGCVMCIMCGNGIWESAYSCIRCDFHLHKLCAKLPENINHHPPHNRSPGHPLTLVRASSKQKLKCKLCGWKYRGYGYSCGSCVDFDVDVGCASDALAINHTGHNHPLHRSLNMASFKCHACGTVHPAGVSYKCKTCPFWVHEDCATLPTTVRYLGHTHQLSLDVGYPSYMNECEICRNVTPMHWTYGCDGCEHFVHVNCLAASLIAEISNTYEVDPEIDLSKVFQVPQTFQYHDLVLQMINHATIHYYGENKEVSPFYHFTHKHPLTLCNQLLQDSNSKKKKTVCSACMLPVSSPQVHYSCTECNNFLLHESCAKLPIELQHPIHPHPLILGRVVVGLGEHGGRTCGVCGGSISGLLYSCTDVKCEGRYFVHSRCILPHAISHTTHQHPLRLYESSSKQGCVACPYSDDEVSYGCKSCGFYLHYHCALQPITIVHRYDKHHPFTLIVDAIEGGPDEEYVCEFCERHIDPKWWFYHCLPCDLSACADCIFKKNRFNYDIPGIGHSLECHNHLLTSFRVDKKNEASLCFTCKKDFLDYKYNVLYCARCNIMFHSRIGCRLISTESPDPLVPQQ